MAHVLVSVTTRSPTLDGTTYVSTAMARAVIDYVRDRRYQPHDGAVGVRGRLAKDEVSFEHAGTPVRMIFGESALAVRETLLDRRPGEWLVIVTDRDEADLGSGVVAHFIGQQLRSPDPWQAVGQRFGATAIDAQLVAGAGHREIAIGLLEALPLTDWPAAPAGVLTRDHAFGVAARSLLDLPEGPIDLVSVLGWTTRPTVTADLAELRRLGGDALTDAVIRWIAAATGEASPVVTAMLTAGRPADLVPLGLVVSFLVAEPTARPAADLALARLSHRWSGVPDRAVRLLGQPAVTVTATLWTDARRRTDAERAIAVADALVREGQAEDLAAASPLLPAGLTRRFRMLAELLQRAAPPLPEVEKAWAGLRQHLLAEGDPRTRAFEAAVRLTRWLETDGQEPPPQGLAALARRQLDSDGWVDAAVNDATAGAGDDQLGRSLGRVLDRTRRIRDAHDGQFAAALAAGGTDTVAVGAALTAETGVTYPLERVLPDVVIPLARRSPVLLLVLDGLSTGVAVEILDDVLNGTGPCWSEQLLAGQRRRAAGLAVLPSITEASRASLLTGTLVRGQQATELRGYAELTTAYGLGSARLFHKRDLDTIRPGFSVADEVRSAVDDPDRRLVTCVLNTIDDALDRSDPAGTHWNADGVKHLRPLLERAREAGRTVVITSDHGHVVERRQGTPRTYAGLAGPTRHRPLTEDTTPADIQPDEVAVRGDRVLVPGNAEILAVSERLRYGPLKAGYHGGAAPAEVVVPLVVLVPIELAQDPEISLAPPQQPVWWLEEVAELPNDRSAVSSAALATAMPTLFDEPAEDRTSARGAGLGPAIVGSAVYREQQQLAGRLAVSDAQVAALVDRLSRATQRRLTAQQVAVVLDLAPAKVAGAFEQLRKVLNVEGYPVISREPATGTLTLDVELAEEQFEVRR